MQPAFPTREDFVATWVKFAHSAPESPEHKEQFWCFQKMCELITEMPEEAYSAILDIWSRDQSKEMAEMLSAGPLETLLSEHGDSFVGRVEEEAGRNPSFATLLGGVWQNSMKGNVWDRVQKVRDRRGWDGIPE